MSKKQKPTPAPQINKMEGTYNGAELHPFTGRPGAMDAFEKPSLINGERQDHRRMAYMTSNVLTPFYSK
ncbi:hypothetical protein UFOVP1309_61 [uncultured Caudovirales phage]|uniref:Uncharacterized protein n=1 Tax=uncultured Caudovirales phage TaxID=2100421 RepID=A0A6J5RL79_9CAUD|nr:hypothetical protein UFOVP1309_61 [uncultured Caudovirales phage]